MTFPSPVRAVALFSAFPAAFDLQMDINIVSTKAHFANRLNAIAQKRRRVDLEGPRFASIREGGGPALDTIPTRSATHANIPVR